MVTDGVTKNLQDPGKAFQKTKRNGCSAFPKRITMDVNRKRRVNSPNKEDSHTLYNKEGKHYDPSTRSV